MSNRREIEEWVEKKRYLDYQMHTDGLIGPSIGLAAVGSFAWVIVSFVAQSTLWAVFADWSVQEGDQVPPYSLEITVSVLVVSYVLIAIALGYTTFVSSRAHRLPHALSEDQIQAANKYNALSSFDQIRLKPSLVAYLLTDAESDSNSIIYDRKNKFYTVLDLINEKKRLERELSMQDEELDVDNELEILDEEISELRSQIEARTLE